MVRKVFLCWPATAIVIKHVHVLNIVNIIAWQLTYFVPLQDDISHDSERMNFEEPGQLKKD